MQGERLCRWLAAFVFSAWAVGMPSHAQTTQLISDASLGGFWTNSESATISADGRWVAFESEADILPGANGLTQVYLRDRPAGTTELVSAAPNGAAANDASGLPYVSTDGRYVAFLSLADNLVPPATPGQLNVFLRDRVNRTTERINLKDGGTQLSAFGVPDTRPAVSQDGRFVVFTSQADDLVSVITTLGLDHVYVRDRATNATILASVDAAGGGPNGNSDDGDMSADGRYVVFDSIANDLLPPGVDTNNREDVFVRDLLLGTTTRVSVHSSGAQSNRHSSSPAVSADGRYVAFESLASNLVTPTTATGRLHVYRHDRTTGATILVSTGFTGQGNDDSEEPRLSADGRYVAFSSLATNFVGGDSNNALDVYVRDCSAGTLARVSLTAAGLEASDHSGGADISQDGSWVSFLSLATDHVASPVVPSGVINVYARGSLLDSPPLAYCTAGTTGNGCTASITAGAHPSLTGAHACSINVNGAEGQRSGVVFYGLRAFSQPWCIPAGTSFLCTPPPVMRTGAQSSGGTAGACDGTFALDWDLFQSTSAAALGAPWSVGDAAYVQCWFRDPPSCRTTNLSNAIELIYRP